MINVGLAQARTPTYAISSNLKHDGLCLDSMADAVRYVVTAVCSVSSLVRKLELG